MAPPSEPSDAKSRAFAHWLNATMQSRGLSQARARVVGVADTQVSRWRRGQVVPTVRYLQRIATTLDVPRSNLDRLAGYPVGKDDSGAVADADPGRQAELDAYSGAAVRLLLEARVPRPLWRAFAEACTALANSMAGTYGDAVASAGTTADPDRRRPPAPGDGTRTPGPSGRLRSARAVPARSSPMPGRNLRAERTRDAGIHPGVGGSMRLLVLGGTVFLGRHIVTRAPGGRSPGHPLQPRAPPGRLPRRRAAHRRPRRRPRPPRRPHLGRRDRHQRLRPPHRPAQRAALTAHAGHYTFISTISVYRDFAPRPGQDETAPTGALEDPATEER